jgi:hypothetical protein
VVEEVVAADTLVTEAAPVEEVAPEAVPAE